MYILYILYHEYKTSYEYKKVYQCYKHEFKGISEFQRKRVFILLYIIYKY